jgi:phage-related protein
MVDFVKANLDDFKEAISHIVNVIVALWNEFGDEILSVVKAVWNDVRAQVEGALQIIRGVIQVFTALINGDWGKAWDGLVQIFAGFGKIIVAGVQLLWAELRAIFTGALGAVVAIVGDRLGTIVGFFVSLPGRIARAMGSLALLLAAKGIEAIRGLIAGSSARRNNCSTTSRASPARSSRSSATRGGGCSTSAARSSAASLPASRTPSRDR